MDIFELIEELGLVLFLLGASLLSWLASRLKGRSERSAKKSERPEPAVRSLPQPNAEGRRGTSSSAPGASWSYEQAVKPVPGSGPRPARSTGPSSPYPPTAPPPVARRVPPLPKTSGGAPYQRSARHAPPPVTQVDPIAADAARSAVEREGVSAEARKRAWQDTTPVPRRRRASAQLGRLRARELRRGILLAEMLGKPIALRHEAEPRP